MTISKERICGETALKIEFLFNKLAFLNEFEKGVVMDRAGAILRFGRNAVISQKQTGIIDEMYRCYNKSLSSCVNELIDEEANKNDLVQH